MKKRHTDARFALLVTLGCVLGVGLMLGGGACQLVPTPSPSPTASPAPFDENPYDTNRFYNEFQDLHVNLHQNLTGDCETCHHMGAALGACDICHKAEVLDGIPTGKEALHTTCRTVGCHATQEDADGNGLIDDCSFCHDELLGE
jgi:hypothetical protein